MSGPVTPPLEVTEVDGNPSGRPITKIIVSNGDLSISGRTATIDTTGSGGIPGGSDTEIQYNDSGAFGGSADFTLTGIGGTDPLLTITNSASDALTLSQKTLTFDGGTGTCTITTTSGDDGLVLTTGTEGVTGPYLFLDAVTSPSQVLLRNQTTDGTITIKTTSGSGDITADAAGDLNLYGDTSVYLRHQTTGSVQVRSATDVPALLQVKTVGDGMPSIDLTDDTRSISLQCDVNQKLKVKGGVNSFVFDASSGTGGITWPDGTTQTTAASGGSSYNQARNPNGAIYSLNDTYILSRGVGMTTVGQLTTSTSTRSGYRQPSFRSFIAPVTGTVSSFSAYVDTAAATASTDITLGIYSDDGGVPDSRLGYADIDCSATGSVTQASITGTISLTEGVQYWYAWVTTNSTDSPTLRAETQADTQYVTGQVAAIAGTDYQVFLVDINATANTLPASITASDLYPSGNLGGNARIGVDF